MARDVWLYSRPVIKTEKIKKSMTLPAATFNCGPVNYGIYQSDAGPSTSGFTINMLSGDSYADFVNALTIEAWVKPISSLSTTKYPIFTRERSLAGLPATGNPQYELSLLGGYPRFVYRKGGVLTAVVSTIQVSAYEWNHVAVTWDGTTIRFIVNGVLDTTTHALAANIDAYVDGNQFFGFTAANALDAFVAPLLGTLDNVRVWNTARTYDEIINHMFSPYLVPSLYTTLVLMARFNEGPGNNTSIEEISGDNIFIGDVSDPGVLDDYHSWEDGFPQKFGASFIVAEYAVSLSKKVSLKFPNIMPEGCTGQLCVRWFDDDGNVQRRKLWSLDGVDIAPPPVEYLGEPLGTSFVLELWNVDGASTVVIPTSGIILYISDTSQPNSSTDHTSVAAATVTADSLLAQDYPLTPFPLTFSVQQTY